MKGMNLSFFCSLWSNGRSNWNKEVMGFGDYISSKSRVYHAVLFIELYLEVYASFILH